MTIYDPNPVTCVSKLRDALAPIADKLRQKAATVEVLDHSGGRTHILAMTIKMRCSIPAAEEMTRKLEGLAERTGGRAHSTLHNPIPADLSEGEYGFGLLYSVAKPRSRMPRHAA